MYVCVTQGHFLGQKTFYTFIEEVNFSNLQKMVLQFAICFEPTMVYTYMVYTLYNKVKHLVQIIQYAFYNKLNKSNKFKSK